jgi:intracellular sulfur oxidation DsrE/DsrF family protein
MIESQSRRQAFGRIGGAMALLAASTASSAQSAIVDAAPPASGSLLRLTEALKRVPRKRQFKTVPFMVTESSGWDEAAARLVLAYTDPAKQVWENSELTAAWPNLMREALNAEVFAHRHPNFLEVSATHGQAHLALFSDALWSRFRLSQLAGAGFASNTLIVEKAGVSVKDDLQDLGGFYGPNNNNITSLQKRGMVFVACHDSIHAIARKLLQAGDPSVAGLSADQIAAELTNGLIPDCVLVPSVVGFLVELQKAGFTYAKGS